MFRRPHVQFRDAIAVVAIIPRHSARTPRRSLVHSLRIRLSRLRDTLAARSTAWHQGSPFGASPPLKGGRIDDSHCNDVSRIQKVKPVRTSLATSLEAIKETIPRLGSPDPGRRVYIHVDTTIRRPDSYPVATCERHAELDPPVLSREHGRIESPCLAGQ